VPPEGTRYQCKGCGEYRDDRDVPCPSCGREDVLVIPPPFEATTRALASLRLDSRRKVAEYVERDWLWLSVLVVFTVATAAVSSFVLGGSVSFVVDLALAVVGGYIGVRATRSVIEHERETQHVP
jgi:hypothetical protein